MIDLLAAYKSRYFTQPHPIIVSYRLNFHPNKNCKVSLQNVVEYTKYSLAKFATFVSISAQMRYAFPGFSKRHTNSMQTFTRLYFPYFTTFHHETLPFY